MANMGLIGNEEFSFRSMIQNHQSQHEHQNAFFMQSSVQIPLIINSHSEDKAIALRRHQGEG